MPQSAQGTQELKENIHYSPEGAVRHPDVKKLKARIDGLMQQYRTRIIDADRTLDSLIKARTKARRTSGGYRGGPNVRILLLSMVDDAIAEVTANSNLAEQQFASIDLNLLTQDDAELSADWFRALLIRLESQISAHELGMKQGSMMLTLAAVIKAAGMRGHDRIVETAKYLRGQTAFLEEQQFQGGPQDLQYDILHRVMKQATWLLGRVPEWEDMQDLYALGKLKLTDVDWELLNILKRSNIFEEDAEV